ncbi:MAG: ATPase, T2SS/T4P/T4SS family, partial [Endomicrobiales bacterium]
MRKTLIGQLLVKKKTITQEELDRALAQQSQTPGVMIGKILVDMHCLTEDALFLVLAEQQGLPFIALNQIPIQPEVFDTLSPEIIYRYQVIPVGWEGEDLCIAVGSPIDTNMMQEIRSALQCTVRFLLATSTDIDNAIKANYGPGRSTSGAGKSFEENFRPVIDTIEALSEGDAGVIRLVDFIMINAYQNRATDIHFESYDDEFRIRYRIDGVLYTLPLPPKIRLFQGSIISRLKVMAGLDIAERRLPQDGRMSVTIGKESLNLRISTLPTPFGEGVQVRVFSTSIFQLADLGLSADHLEIIEKIIQKPHGIMFVCGPTGSGKTTTLYACLHRLNTSTRKIIT